MELVRNPHSMGQYMINYLAGEGKKDKSYQNKAPDWAKNVGRWWGPSIYQAMGNSAYHFHIAL